MRAGAASDDGRLLLRVGVGLLLIAIALAVVDWVADWPALWKHSMLTEVFAGLLLLGVTVFCVDTVVRRREERDRAVELEARWRGLGGIGFRSLATALGDLVDGMAWLLTGAHPLDHPEAVGQQRAEHLYALLCQYGLEPVQTNDTGDLSAGVFDERLGPVLESRSLVPTSARLPRSSQVALP